jgi:hypothetical protein
VLVGAVDRLLVVLVNRRWFCWSLVGRSLLSFQQVNSLFQSCLMKLSTTAVGLLVGWSQNITHFGKRKKSAFGCPLRLKKCLAI